ncbi:hypothetical protein GCM10009837_16750 [Streptomyces durmitorensis]|uniref:DUF4352 domain-containing protein n=1 Tax=Streptomyces durmitorensis TaxID=319947 RepID=A0ABY4PQE5_9ACTN|nr:DUF4352 domain-containing protein [Streptomyces durmitorensis]UQT55625.1 DUF4352 domain-containing protein [Streptomyces durmitorensis]
MRQMRRVSAVLLSACAVLVVGAAGPQTMATSAGATVAASSTGRQSVDGPSPREPGVGTTLSLTGIGSGERLDVTVVKVVDPARTANEFLVPDAGNRYVAVQFRLKNTGDDPYKDSPSNGAALVDADGQHFDAALIAETTAGPSFPGALSISPGDTALGFITFELPTSARPVQLQFSMNSGFSDDVGEWSLVSPPK